MHELLLRRLDLGAVQDQELAYGCAYILARAQHARDVGHGGTGWLLDGLALVVQEERDRRAKERRARG